MTDKRFHLAWFLNFTPDEWRDPFGQGGQPWDGQFYVDIARNLERACFDFVIFEDKLLVSETTYHQRRAGHARSFPGAWQRQDPAPVGRGRPGVSTRLDGNFGPGGQANG